MWNDDRQTRHSSLRFEMARRFSEVTIDLHSSKHDFRKTLKHLVI